MADALSDSIGQTETRIDLIDRRRLKAVAATLDTALPEGSPLPPLWHWTLFQNWAPYEGLRQDGGVKAEGFLPQMAQYPRRMAAGGRVSFHSPLFAGDAVSQEARIARVEEKTGASGALVFLTLERRISGPKGLAIVEENDVVYLPEGAGGSRREPKLPEPLPASAIVHARQGHPVMLFRYSAMTANSHRIHYDLQYATEVEKLPGLLVHGPLQATWLAALAVEVVPERPLARIAFRNTRPAYHHEELTIAGWPSGEGARLEVRNERGFTCMTAEASFA